MTRLHLLGAVLLLLPVCVANAELDVRHDLQAMRACAGDVRKLCAGIMPGEGRIKACIKENLGKLSPACVDAVITAAVGDDKKPVPVPIHPTEMTFDNLRAVQYCEVWTLFGNAETGFFGDSFNTSNLNNNVQKQDTCPANRWADVSTDKLTDEFAIFWAFKNGPRGWTIDKVTLPVGPVVNFSGVDTRWWGRGVLPGTSQLAAVQNGLKPYTALQSHRKSTFSFAAGKPVFIMEDPDGTPWVMQAWSKIIDPTLTYDDLKNLGSKLKLPEGWKFRVATPDKELIVSTPLGYHWIVQDDLGNTYDACKEGACNLQP